MRYATCLIFASLALGCGATRTRRFPLRDPMWKDTDFQTAKMPCRPDPKKPNKQVCTPEPYESPLVWDAADNTVFRPISGTFAVKSYGKALNVNAVDEVPDSSWFENRIGQKPMTPEEVAKGPCKVLLDEREWPDGSWLIDEGKPNGATPGFRIKLPELGKFMLKSDTREQPERPSAASAIVVRLYHAVGFNVACDSVVYFDPKVLKLTPGLESTDNTKVTKPFDQKALEAVLDFNVKRGKEIRMQSSQWLPGKPLGPFSYEGVRDDDPNDVIPHEDRRDLRGSRMMAAWTQHFDAREQNTMASWMPDDDKKPDSPGFVKHFILDVSDCFGSTWPWDRISRRLGHSYYLDVGDVGVDFLTLGLLSRPWDRARPHPNADLFGYYRAIDFEPDQWKAGYPNPTFNAMDEEDGAWISRIIARLTPEHVRAAIKTGRLTNPVHEQYLFEVVLARQRRILRRFLSKLSPVTDVIAKDHQVCAVDIARKSRAFPETAFTYGAKLYAGDPLTDSGALKVDAKEDGSLCFQLPATTSKDPDGAMSRYRVVDVTNNLAVGPLRVHFYDLGDRGLKLVGIERPNDADPPR